jgi:glutamyl-tRNA reductase
MVDLAVPPDIEREVGELRDVYLYGVDDLQSVIEDNMRSRELAREQAMDIIAMQVNEFMRWRSSLASVDVIKSFRGRFEDIRDAELQRALGQLGREKPEVVLQQLANRLTNKFLHQPTLYLQNAEDDERHHKAEHIQQIFRLRNANKE